MVRLIYEQSTIEEQNVRLVRGRRRTAHDRRCQQNYNNEERESHV
ncbi:MAG: hypothetical protein ACMXYM_01595 [Candidatus Woesearchaeota archaeon]